MARVNWHGTEIQAELIDQLPNGKYRMRSHGQAPRVEPGTIIEVDQSQIVGLNIGGRNFNGPGAAAQVAGQQSGQTFTSVPPQQASNPTGLQQGANPMPPQGPTASNSLPLTQNRISQSSLANTSDVSRTSTMATAKTPKLNSLMEGFNSMIAAVEDSADAVHKKFAAIGETAKTSTAKLSKAADPIVAMVQQIDDTANQLSNGGPEGPLPGSTA